MPVGPSGSTRKRSWEGRAHIVSSRGAGFEIGGDLLLRSVEYPECGDKSPTSLGGSPMTQSLYVEHVDRVTETFVAHGGRDAGTRQPRG